jgi:CRP-like cAMP-binding protein
MSLHSANTLLSSLSSDSLKQLLDGSKHIPLPLRWSLYEPELTPEYAYFLTSGIASVVTIDPDGGTAEVGLTGREGAVGVLHILGPAIVPSTCFIQLAGEGYRVPLSQLRHAFDTSPEIRGRVLEFVQAQALSLGQIAGCHRLHGAEERLARWLLMAQDRADSETLNLTQEFLATMLGARRTTVTIIAGVLQKSGLIEYSRGRVRILSRENLEAAACDCYQITRKLYDSLYTSDRSPQL